MLSPILKRFVTDQSGAAAIVIALMMPIVLGGLGLGAEFGYWYFNQRKLQNAADVAAYAAAAELRAGHDQAAMDGAALSAAETTGYKSAIGTLATASPPTSGTFVGDTGAVEVTVSENVPRMFSVFFADGAVAMSGRAVAQIMQGMTACVLALDPDAVGAVTFTGSADVTLDGCNVHANSLDPAAVTVTGAAAVATPCVSAVGGVSATDGLTMTTCTSAVQNADPIDDPYESLAEPSEVSAVCQPQNTFGGPAGSTYTISPGRYCGGLRIQRTVTMNPGVYVIDGGDFDITSTAVVVGNGIMLYLTNGATMDINGSATAQLTAPAEGQPYEGILVYADREDPYGTHLINGNSSSYFDGAIYVPSGKVQYTGNSSVGGGCTQIVALHVDFYGNSTIGTDCVGTGVSQIATNQVITLVE